MENCKGKVWLVGAGPSDPGLITVKGLDVLRKADVVVYDRLVGIEILNLIPKGAKIIDVGKSPNHHPIPQDMINQILLQEALEGKMVVRLKGGDPFLFGRGGEELELLCQFNVPYEVVPGITSAISVPAYAGIPVTHRGLCSSMHIITGHKKVGEKLDLDFEAAVRLKGTLIFMMSVSSLKTICDGLILGGMPANKPCAIIERGTTARQRKVISTIGKMVEDAEEKQIENPAVLVVGEVSALSDHFEWISHRPLNGKRVVVTRPENLCSVLSEKIREQGGEALEFPCIKTIPIDDETSVYSAIERIRTYDWLVFTSAFGVELFFDRFSIAGRDVRELFGIKIGVIGSGTGKEFVRRGIKVDYTPENYDVKSLAEGLAERIGPGEKILIFRAKEGSADLNQIFNAYGISFEDVAIYKTVFNTENCNFSKEIIEDYQFDYAAFTSVSTVKGFVNALPNLDYSRICAVCIGEETAKEARRYGMNCIVSEKATLDGVVNVMVNNKN